MCVCVDNRRILRRARPIVGLLQHTTVASVFYIMSWSKNALYTGYTFIVTTVKPSVVANNAITLYRTGVTAVTRVRVPETRFGRLPRRRGDTTALSSTTTKTSGRRSMRMGSKMNGGGKSTNFHVTDARRRAGGPRRNNRNEATTPAAE